MIGSSVILFGCVYVLAQCLATIGYKGRWRLAAFLPIPVLAVFAIGAVAAAVILGADTGPLILFGLPVATVYLTVLSGAHWVARTFGGGLRVAT